MQSEKLIVVQSSTTVHHGEHVASRLVPLRDSDPPQLWAPLVHLHVSEDRFPRARAYYADRDPGRVKDISAFHERAKYEGGPQNAWQFGQVLGAANARSTQAKNCV